MAWMYLLFAGLFEIGWPVGLKLAQQSETRIVGIIAALGFMAASGWLLWLAQNRITSYNVCYTKLLRFRREKLARPNFLNKRFFPSSLWQKSDFRHSRAGGNPGCA